MANAGPNINAPPTAGPPPGPATSPVTAGLAPSPTAASLCGFALPSLRFKFGFVLPALPALPKLPSIHLPLGLNCSQNNPLAVAQSGGKPLPYGGGRTPNADPDPDYVEQAST
jgi:hypothetical protein